MHVLGHYGKENAAAIFELFLECMPEYPLDKPDNEGNTGRRERSGQSLLRDKVDAFLTIQIRFKNLSDHRLICCCCASQFFC